MTFDERQLCKSLKHLRELRDFTQTYLADSLGISARAYSKIEQGSSQLSVKRLYQIAEVLEVSVNDILQFSNERYFNSNYRNPVSNDAAIIKDIEGLKDLYERLLTEKDVQIQLLLEKISKLS